MVAQMIQHSTDGISVKEQHADTFDTNKRWYFSTQNVTMLCNSLPQDTVEAKSLHGLKKLIRKIHGAK